MLRKTPLQRKTGFKARQKPLQRRSTLKSRTTLKTRRGFHTKLPSIKAVKRNTWQAVSRYIRARDPFCVTCLIDGRHTPTTEAGHFKHTSDKINQTLGGNMVWWDERNLNGQCARCNRHNSGELDLYAIYLERKFGPGILQELDTLYRTPKKWTRDEAKAVQLRYETKLASLTIHKQHI
jgi:5-methylcytosine-specific restriction endonuclease McrA